MSICTGGGCEDCGRKEYMDFLVSNRTWNLVIAGVCSDREGVGGVVCLECFDHRARVAGVEYRDEVVVFGTDCWMAGGYEGGLPKCHRERSAG